MNGDVLILDFQPTYVTPNQWVVTYMLAAIFVPTILILLGAVVRRKIKWWVGVTGSLMCAGLMLVGSPLFYTPPEMVDITQIVEDQNNSVASCDYLTIFPEDPVGCVLSNGEHAELVAYPESEHVMLTVFSDDILDS